MSINLIESNHRTQRSVRSTLVSVAVHACLITLAVYASASAGEVIVNPPIDSVIVFYPKAPKKPADPGKTAMQHSTSKPPAPGPVLRNPIEFTGIPAVLPPVDSSTPTIDDATLFRSSTKGDSDTAGDGIGNDGEPLFAAQVEKPATPRNGNPSPKYPSLLERSRVEGNVLVQFVVDTLGVADMGTFKVLDATNDLFGESTRATLSKWRFFPAEANGHKVKQIVQLPLRFLAPHR